jgi:hypothetical protein
VRVVIAVAGQFGSCFAADTERTMRTAAADTERRTSRDEER